MAERGPCVRRGGDDCEPRPNLSQVPPLGRNSAVLKTTGYWIGHLVVPRQLARERVSCEHDPYSEQWKTEAWRFSVGSDEDADSEYGLDDGDGWFQIEVRTNGGHADFSAEAVLAFSDGDLFTATDSSSRIDLDKPVLEWAISEDRKVVRFAFRAPAAPDFAYERYNEIGTVLVRGAIRCSE